MKILICGSHFTPAQATIKELQSRFKAEVVYIGRENTREGDKSPSLESQILPKMGVKFIALTTGRLQRSFTLHTLPSLLKIPIGFLQSLYILNKEKPDVILSFGGYLAVPVVVAGWLLSVPIIIHEQTLVTGLANKITSFFADKIAVSFSNHKFSFPEEKLIVTGNPLRAEVISVKVKRSKVPTLLVTAGNQGSHIINQTVGQKIDQLTKDYLVIHQTGESAFNDYEQLEKIRQQLKDPSRYQLQKYLFARQMGEAMASASLAVVRGGMNTLLELNYFKVPMIIIPIDRHFEQTTNAKFFAKEGLANYLPQKELTPEVLLKLIREKISNPAKVSSNSSLVKIDAAAHLALETVLLVKK